MLCNISPTKIHGIHFITKGFFFFEGKLPQKTSLSRPTLLRFDFRDFAGSGTLAAMFYRDVGGVSSIYISNTTIVAHETKQQPGMFRSVALTLRTGPNSMVDFCLLTVKMSAFLTWFMAISLGLSHETKTGTEFHILSLSMVT